jgi:glycosyltransferase involved in cell wall biosynthesis
VKRLRPNQCVFVGVLDYRPNIDGLFWFCNQVWPIVLAQNPDAEFAIVGRNPTPAVRRLALRPSIRLVGEVPDVRPYVAESRFAVAPLQIARGIQNKILEAMAMGKPVVATPQALDGLGIEGGIHALAAIDPQHFAEAACRLYRDESLCLRLAELGQEYVRQQHNWETCLKPLARMIDLSRRSLAHEFVHELGPSGKSFSRFEEISI